MPMRMNILDTTELTSSTNSASVPLKYCENWSVQANSTVTTPSTDTFADADVGVAANTITLTAHALAVGLKCQLTTTGVLPAGLALTTDYFVIDIDANTIKLASSLANAQAGTAVDITAAAGGGTHTLTPTSLAGGVMKLQASNDNSNWVDIASATANITATGSVMVNAATAGYKWGRANVVVTAGMLTTELIAAGKECCE